MNRRVKTYIFITLLISWIVAFISNYYGKLIQFIPLIMAVPATIALITRLISDGFNKDIYRNPNAKGFSYFLKAVLFSIVYPILFVSICGFVGALIYHQNIDKSFVMLLFNPKIIIKFVLNAATISALTAFGEEYGWRGFLLQEISKTKSKVLSSTIVGIVWALYHIPILILLSPVSNLGNPYLVALIQGGAAFLFSYSFSYCYFISNRLYPTVIMHSFWNMFNPFILGSIYTGTSGFLLTKGNILITNGEGVFGVIFGALFAILFIILLSKNRKASI